jgi:hypothetical protein
VKTPLDRHAVVACLIAYGTNIGLGKMGAISDLSYQTLFTAANNFLRPETLREGNDQVSNATAKLPIFRHYNIDDVIHSSSDGQKFETQIHTIRSRHSSISAKIESIVFAGRVPYVQEAQVPVNRVVYGPA